MGYKGFGVTGVVFLMRIKMKQAFEMVKFGLIGTEKINILLYENFYRLLSYCHDDRNMYYDLVIMFA